MNIRTILIMGLLSMLVSDCKVQRKLTEQEQAYKDALLYSKPKYEAEIKALIMTDTLYLVDRRYVNPYPSDFISYDDTKVIPLTCKEKQTITDAYKEGTLDVSDNGIIYDEHGAVEGFYETATTPAFYAYLFVARNTFILSYNNGIFKCENTAEYWVTISDKWKQKVESIIKKYCPDSFSQSEKYWVDKADERWDEKRNEENLQWN